MTQTRKSGPRRSIAPLGDHDEVIYVYLDNGTFVNAWLVENGYAVVMTFPPNVKYEALFLKLQRAAREAGRGLWR